MNKTLVLGLDACSWEILDKARKKDVIPTISKHISEGYTSEMESWISQTTPAWKAMTTGKNPGKIGVFANKIYRWGEEGEIPLQSDFRSSDYWDYLNHYKDISTAIINLPNTYKPRPLDGVMIAGRGIPSAGELHVWPDSEKDNLKEIGHQPYKGGKYENVKENPEGHLKKNKKYIKSQFETAEHYLSKFNVVHLTTLVTDIYEHAFLDDEPTMRLYGFIDDCLEKIESNHSDMNLIIVSDHGMTKGPSKRIYMNTWLKKRGYFSEENSLITNEENISKLKPIYDSLPERGKNIVKKMVKGRGIQKSITQSLSDIPYYNVDWENSTAVCKSRIILVRNSNNQVIDEIIEQFNQDFDHLFPNDVQPLVRAEKVFEGPYLDTGPDIIINNYMKRHARYTHVNGGDTIIEENFSPGWKHEHDPIGVFIANGPDINSSEEREKSTIYDFAPTILAMSGIHLEGGLDGVDVCSKRNDQELQTVPELPPPNKDENVNREYTQKVSDQLRDLGYLK